MKKRLRLIIVAFSISFLLMAVLSFYAVRQFSSLIEYSQQVDHTNEVITHIYQLETLIKELDVKERGYMITKDSSFLIELFTVNNTILPLTLQLQNSFHKDKVQLTLLTDLRATLIDRRDNIRKNLSYVDTASSLASSPYFLEGRTYREKAIQDLEQLRKREDDMLGQRFRNKIHYQQITYSVIRYLLSVFALVTVVLFIWMIRELRKRVAYQDELQRKIADLKRSHEELEQIANAVSHDLQEPLRKIQIFSDKLMLGKKGEMDTETVETLERINTSAGRMHGLIVDLMNVTSLVKEEQNEKVNLNNTMNIVLEHLQATIKHHNAIINVEALPEILGNSRQLHLLFKSLIENALKFSKDNVTPVISVRHDKIMEEELSRLKSNLGNKYFNRITVADNGIGFENKFINKMFQIFQSLHNKDSNYEGKGIGLAICQRVMVNHGGYILAEGHSDVGATFKLYFPVTN